MTQRPSSTCSRERIATMAHARTSFASALRVLAMVWMAAATLVGAGNPGDAVPGVLDLLPTTFDGHVNGGKHVLVEFYAPYVAN